MTDETKSEPSEEAKTAPQTAQPGEDPSHPAAEVAEIADLEEIEAYFPVIERSPSLKELIQSSDSPSRFMAILAVVFGVLALMCISLLVYKYLEYRHRQTQTAISIKDPNHLDPIFTQNLGEFRVQWKSMEMRGDLTAQCTTEEACALIKTRLNEVRDHVLVILQESSGEAILNPEKKLLIRRKILDQLNEFPLKGKVSEVNFTDLVVEPIRRR